MKGFKKCISKIPGNLKIQEVQNCVRLVKVHILRRSLSIVWTITLTVALRLTDGLVSEKSRMRKKKRKNHYNDRFSDLLKLVKRGPVWKEVVSILP